MSKGIIALLVLTNLGTGYSYFEYREAYRAAVSDKTTDRERETYGASCVDWLNEKTADRKISLALARSWRKHGQMVFEVVPATDEDWQAARKLRPDDPSPALLCTYDRQSGTMYVVDGDERKRWMFYE